MAETLCFLYLWLSNGAPPCKAMRHLHQEIVTCTYKIIWKLSYHLHIWNLNKS
jgi:hypothetical protein